MNFAKTFKTQMILVALGASLVMTGKVYSQEIVNTDFDNPATSIGTNFNAPALATVNTPEAKLQLGSSELAPAAVAPANEPQEANVVGSTRPAAIMLAIAILLLAYAILRRISFNQRNVIQTI
jgi:hypothetical protein